jgi:hypothetical protein
VRRGVAGPARPQVQVHEPGQQDRLVPQVARVPGPGQARRAEMDLLDRAACSAMLDRGPAAQWQVTGK